jgi:hypothetical protein
MPEQPMPEKLKAIVVLLGLEGLLLLASYHWFLLAGLIVLIAGLIRGDDRARVFLLVIAAVGLGIGVLSLSVSFAGFNAGVPMWWSLLMLAASLFTIGCGGALMWALRQADVRAWMMERTKVFEQRAVDTMGPYRSMSPSSLPPASVPSVPVAPRAAGFTDLERAVLAKLLEGEHDILSALRAQLAVAKLAYRQRSAKGIVLNLTVPTDARPVEGQPDLRIDDVLARIDGLAHEARFVLSVRSGRLASLEAITRNEPWPDAIPDFSVDYVEPKDAGEVQQRWISQVQPRST